MATAEIIGLGLLLAGCPSETAQDSIIQEAVVVETEQQELAVLPKVLKIVQGEIYWVEQ